MVKWSNIFIKDILLFSVVRVGLKFLEILDVIVLGFVVFFGDGKEKKY